MKKCNITSSEALLFAMDNKDRAEEVREFIKESAHACSWLEYVSDTKQDIATMIPLINDSESAATTLVHYTIEGNDLSEEQIVTLFQHVNIVEHALFLTDIPQLKSLIRDMVISKGDADEAVIWNDMHPEDKI